MVNYRYEYLNKELERNAIKYHSTLIFSWANPAGMSHGDSRTKSLTQSMGACHLSIHGHSELTTLWMLNPIALGSGGRVFFSVDNQARFGVASIK